MLVSNDTFGNDRFEAAIRSNPYDVVHKAKSGDLPGKDCGVRAPFHVEDPPVSEKSLNSMALLISTADKQHEFFISANRIRSERRNTIPNRTQDSQMSSGLGSSFQRGRLFRLLRNPIAISCKRIGWQGNPGVAGIEKSGKFQAVTLDKEIGDLRQIVKIHCRAVRHAACLNAVTAELVRHRLQRQLRLVDFTGTDSVELSLLQPLSKTLPQFVHAANDAGESAIPVLSADSQRETQITQIDVFIFPKKSGQALNLQAQLFRSLS